MSKKILNHSQLELCTQAGGFNKVLCGQALVLCNVYWPDFLKGGHFTDDNLGTLDCGTCSYMANQCGWKYVYGGTGGSTAWEECKWICTCH